MAAIQSAFERKFNNRKSRITRNHDILYRDSSNFLSNENYDVYSDRTERKDEKLKRILLIRLAIRSREVISSDGFLNKSFDILKRQPYYPFSAEVKNDTVLPTR